VKYMAYCALPANDSLVKKDQNGVSYTFPGGIGVCPALKTGSGDDVCLESVSACMMAHVNNFGIHVPLYLTSNIQAIGFGSDAQFPVEEGSFFGNIFKVGAHGSSTLQALYCESPILKGAVVSGRIGANTASTVYRDPFGTNVTCDRGCTFHGSSTSRDGYSNCSGWNQAITVYRTKPYEAEFAMLAGNAKAVPAKPNNSNSARVGYIYNGASLTFNNVSVTTAGTHTLYIYFINATAAPLSMGVSVNGGASTTYSFPVTAAVNNWDANTSTVTVNVTLKAGNNTVKLTAPSSGWSPDVDWITVR